MTNFLSKNGYYIYKKNLNNNEYNTIKNELTVSPHKTFKHTQNEVIRNFNETEDMIIIPRFYGLEKFGKPEKNKLVDGLKIDVSFTGNMRNMQKDIVDIIIPYINKNNGGILCLPCGFGKTIISLYLICYYKIKTLIIVHKTFLLNQWVEKCNEFIKNNTNVDNNKIKIGIIQGTKIDVEDKDIVIGMLQSISKDKYDSSVFKDFGLTIFDEAHHAPSKFFSQALPIISSKRTIGLSATPKREDKLEKILYWFFGNIMYKIDNPSYDKLSINSINFTSCDINFKEFKMYNGDLNRSLTINKLSEINERNDLIIKIILHIIKDKNRKLILLSDRINQLNIIESKLKDNNIDNYSYYIGKMKQDALDKSSTAQIILGTYSMASEGLDIPELNCLIFCTPRKQIEQSIGRIVRKINDDTLPVVYDIIDRLPSLVNQYYARKKIYHNFNCKVGIINNIDDLNDVEYTNNKNIIINDNTKTNTKTNIKTNKKKLSIQDIFS